MEKALGEGSFNGNGFREREGWLLCCLEKIQERRFATSLLGGLALVFCIQNTRARPRNKPLGGLALVFCAQNTRERPLKGLALVFFMQNTMETALGKGEPGWPGGS